MTAHPNYQPDPDDQTTALTTTVVTSIQVYNPNGVLVDCIVGGTYQPLRNYVRTTSAGIPYLQFSVTFTTYNNNTGIATATNSFNPVYFALNTITPAPLPYGLSRQ
jgi:hypothetical protein